MIDDMSESLALSAVPRLKLNFIPINPFVSLRQKIGYFIQNLYSQAVGAGTIVPKATS
jgi:hypothetical protein